MFANNPFAVPLLKVQNALTHVREVDALVNAFMAESPHKFVVHTHLHPKWRIHAVQFSKPTPTAILLKTADAIGNLRAALDGMAVSLARANGAGSIRDVHFPFAADLSEFNSARTQRKIRTISEQGRNLIARLRPYRGGNDALYAINELANLDKHHGLLIPTIIGEGPIIANPSRGMDIAGLDGGPITPEWHSDTQSLIFWATRVDSDLIFEGQVTGSIGFGKPKILEKRAVVPTLYELCGMVERIILIMKAECFDSLHNFDAENPAP